MVEVAAVGLRGLSLMEKRGNVGYPITGNFLLRRHFNISRKNLNYNYSQEDGRKPELKPELQWKISSNPAKTYMIDSPMEGPQLHPIQLWDRPEIPQGKGILRTQEEPH